jgi:hypothetical protein
MVQVIEVECLHQRFLQKEPFPTVHGHDKLIKIYLSGPVVIDFLQDFPHLVFSLQSKMFLADFHKLSVFNDSIVIGIDLSEQHAQFVPLLLRDKLHGEILFDNCNEVVPLLRILIGT